MQNMTTSNYTCTENDRHHKTSTTTKLYIWLHNRMCHSVNSHTLHTLSTDLSWDGQFLILWQQLRKEAVGRGDLAVEDREQGSDEYIHTLLHYLFYY